jgi:RHS repeat-associated protein
VTAFDYDGLGRRVRERLNGAETRHWLWCGLELCEERDAANNVTKRFYAQGEQIAGTNYFYTRDHLGSVRELVDANGTTLHARYDYDLYGQRTANIVTANAVESDFGYTGHQEFAAIGLIGAPLRLYQQTYGRWLSRDPIGEDGGMNLYRYVGGMPIGATDPLGLRSCAELKQMLDRELHNFLAATQEANDEQSTLTAAKNANSLQKSLLSASTVMSLGAGLLGGIPLIGFAGYGTSSAVVGSGTSVVMTGAAGPGLTLTRYGSTLGNSAIRTGAVTGTVAVVRAGEKYLDPRTDNRADDASNALANAMDAREAALNAIHRIQQEMKKCRCQ